MVRGTSLMTLVLAAGFVAPPLDYSTPTAFADRGPYRFRIGRIRVRANAATEGGLRRSGRWTATSRSACGSCARGGS